MNIWELLGKIVTIITIGELLYWLVVRMFFTSQIKIKAYGGFALIELLIKETQKRITY